MHITGVVGQCDIEQMASKVSQSLEQKVGAPPVTLADLGRAVLQVWREERVPLRCRFRQVTVLCRYLDTHATWHAHTAIERRRLLVKPKLHPIASSWFGVMNAPVAIYFLAYPVRSIAL